MVTVLPQWRAPRPMVQAFRLIPVVVALALLAAIASLLAWSYVAQPAHPDGVCYESRGRPMPCFLLEKRRSAPR